MEGYRYSLAPTEAPARTTEVGKPSLQSGAGGSRASDPAGKAPLPRPHHSRAWWRKLRRLNSTGVLTAMADGRVEPLNLELASPAPPILAEPRGSRDPPKTQWTQQSSLKRISCWELTKLILHPHPISSPQQWHPITEVILSQWVPGISLNESNAAPRPSQRCK